MSIFITLIGVALMLSPVLFMRFFKRNDYKGDIGSDARLLGCLVCLILCTIGTMIALS